MSSRSQPRRRLSILVGIKDFGGMRSKLIERALGQTVSVILVVTQPHVKSVVPLSTQAYIQLYIALAVECRHDCCLRLT